MWYGRFVSEAIIAFPLLENKSSIDKFIVEIEEILRDIRIRHSLLNQRTPYLSAYPIAGFWEDFLSVKERTKCRKRAAIPI